LEKVDNMIEEHEQIMDNLKKYSESLKAVATENNTVDNIDDFMNGKEKVTKIITILITLMVIK
jgi:hypothetical protein